MVTVLFTHTHSLFPKDNNSDNSNKKIGWSRDKKQQLLNIENKKSRPGSCFSVPFSLPKRTPIVPILFLKKVVLKKTKNCKDNADIQSITHNLTLHFTPHFQFTQDPILRLNAPRSLPLIHTNHLHFLTTLTPLIKAIFYPLSDQTPCKLDTNDALS